MMAIQISRNMDSSWRCHSGESSIGIERTDEESTGIVAVDEVEMARNE